VLFVVRLENGGKFCVGRRVRYKSCNHMVSMRAPVCVNICFFFTDVNKDWTCKGKDQDYKYQDKD